MSKKTVVVLNNGSAIDMQAWIDDVDAVLEAWLPGQAGAGAIIDILYGNVNPSGKLGETFPLKLEHTPSHLTFPGERDEVRYGEGIFVGYRGYEATGRDVLFPFGYGLSYTTFEYSNLQVSSVEFTINDTLEVSLDVTNTGLVAGKEVVQLYVRDVQSRLPRPHKELKAFAKVVLEAVETKTVTLRLNDRAFSYYDPTYSQWLAEAGEFEIIVGSSSADIRLRETVTMTNGTKVPSILHIHSPIYEWMEDPRGAELVRPMLAQAFGDGESSAIGVNMAEFFRDLPLTKLLAFRGGDLEGTPEETVEDFLRRVKA